MGYAIRVDEGAAVDLAAISPRQHGGLTKIEGQPRFEALAEELGDLQELLYAAGDVALLAIFQGMDTAGKDGAIRHVFKDMDPQGVRVASFKVPTALELAHDFLWRVHREVPETGMVGVFNRSHYESVLVERVKGLVPEATWRARYGHINAFERLLVDEGTIVLKFFLHISREEQEERLLAREQDVTKAWKLNAGDWAERRLWDDYQHAYADALAHCSTAAAPWWIVPADHKWFRDLAIAEVVRDALAPRRDGWLATLKARGEAELAGIRAARAAATSA
jgi:PPK2 family polyphosphate:nucleotide phosphotransferase